MEEEAQSTVKGYFCKCSVMRLPDLAKKNTGCTGELEFHINDESFFNIRTCLAIFVMYLKIIHCYLKFNITQCPVFCLVTHDVSHVCILGVEGQAAE